MPVYLYQVKHLNNHIMPTQTPLAFRQAVVSEVKQLLTVLTEQQRKQLNPDTFNGKYTWSCIYAQTSDHHDHDSEDEVASELKKRCCSSFMRMQYKNTEMDVSIKGYFTPLEVYAFNFPHQTKLYIYQFLMGKRETLEAKRL